MGKHKFVQVCLCDLLQTDLVIVEMSKRRENFPLFKRDQRSNLELLFTLSEQIVHHSSSWGDDGIKILSIVFKDAPSSSSSSSS